MPWFKVDDNLAFHHKVIAAGNPALGLWVRAGSACAQQLTDGFVPDHLANVLGTLAQAERLVKVGLWDRVEGGYKFHGWSERQPSKASVEAERAAAADRMREHRARRKRTTQKALPQVSESGSAELPRSFGVGSAEVRDSFGNPDPSHPDPSKYFDDFWAAYPRKESKGHARTAFTKAAKKAEPSVIIDAAMAFGLRVAGSDPKFIAHPTTWLNGERWDDEALEAAVIDTGWHTPWTPPIAPPEIADNPELYGPWLDEQRKAAGR
jgi:hypothetical protein